MNPEEMKELEKNARDLILAIAEKTLKTLKDNGLLKEPSSLQKLSFSNPEIRAFLEKFKAPKYDPCRKFKESDIVDYRRVHGRDYETVPDPEDYEFARVIADEEDESGMVWVEFISEYGGDDACYEVPWFHLVLVTPVEELERYYIEHDSTGYAILDRQNVGYVAHFKAVNHPHAKEAAEAERDRLNAEYRKEQNND